MELVTVWWPIYPLAAGVKVLCAAASVPTAIFFALAAPGLAKNIRQFLQMLSTTQQEKDQAVGALLASEKLVVAGRISASISHEIKNPLETAGNLLYLLAADPRMPRDLVAMAKTASSELQRADEIAQSNLSLLRKSSAPVQVSLADLVDGVLDLQAPQLIGHDISLQRRLRAPLPLKAYSSELRQILINLIQNAVAAIGFRGRIIVRVQLRRSLGANSGEAESMGQPGYSITIADNGPGINAKHRSQLFTMFLPPKAMRAREWGFGWCVPWWRNRVGGSAFAPALPRNAISPGPSSISGYRCNQHLLQP